MNNVKIDIQDLNVHCNLKCDPFSGSHFWDAAAFVYFIVISVDVRLWCETVFTKKQEFDPF